jgi:hypothetical protein
MRILFILLISFMLLPECIEADSASQTNWIGSSGVLGPVSFFHTNYYERDSWIHCPPEHLKLSAYGWNLIEDDFWACNCVRTNDMNLDSNMDVVASDNSWDWIAWWENVDNSGLIWIQHPIASAVSINEFQLVDMNEDGAIDILAAVEYYASAATITWWENVDGLGTEWAEHLIASGIHMPYSVDFNDIDKDGDIDVFAVGLHEYNIWWWENEGSGLTWTWHLIDDDWWGGRCVHTEDIDNDSDTDVMTAGNKGIVWWINVDGSGLSWNKITVDSANSFDSSLNDVDMDGDQDILSTSNVSDEIVWWENDDGAGASWTKHIINDNFRFPGALVSGDVDLDGDIDVVTGGRVTNHRISFWENINGTGNEWEEHLIDANHNGSESLFLSDINGDSTMNIISGGPGHLIWYEAGACSTGQLESSILYIGGDGEWDSIDWIATEPPGTSVSFLVRASDNYESMGTWSDTLKSPCSLDGILDDYDSFIQYRVILTTTDSTVSPTLDDVTFSWNSLGIEAGMNLQKVEILPVSPNPSNSSPLLVFTVPEPTTLSISVFDLSGRLIFELEQSQYDTGCHSVRLNDLSTGIFFCSIKADVSEDMQRFVVIE